MENTAVTLFVYKRPDHTRRVLEGIRRNEITELYVFADGAKPTDNQDRIDEVRDVVRSVDWCNVHLTERDQNWGLAENTIDGLESVFEEHDRVIMLEDDDVPTADFVDYMTACFDRYEDDDRVMSVTGYGMPIDISNNYPYDVYFTHRDCSWGWGTWKSAWEQYERKPEEMRQRIAEDREQVKLELQHAGEDLFPILEQQLNGENDSWSVWWALSILENDGVCVNPVRSRIKDIGHDGSGTHCSTTDRYEVQTTDQETMDSLRLPEEVEINETLNRRFNDYAIRNRWKRLRRKLQHVVGKLVS